MKTIVQKENTVLRQIAAAVPPETIKSIGFQTILDDMKRALDSQDDGVAIAAPQIGESLRVFIVSGRALARAENEGDEKAIEPTPSDLICINPILTKLSRKKELLEEGCLSVRYLYGKVSRSEKATITALDRDGNKFMRGATGLLAQIFQHEMDHLEGVLFIDKARDVRDIPPNA